MKHMEWNKLLEYFYGILTSQYRKASDIATVTPDIALYVVTRGAAPSDNIQCNIRKYYTSDSECNIQFPESLASLRSIQK